MHVQRFDIFCPATYPKSPPQVWFCTTAGGKIRFNPNMYENGKGQLLIYRSIFQTPEMKKEKETIKLIIEQFA